MRQTKVLILIDRLGQGGVAQVVVDTAVTIDRSRFSPIICLTRSAPTRGQDEILRQAGIPLIELNRRSRWQLSSWKKLWQVLPTVTILHSHQSGSNFWGRIWGRLFGTPIIITQEHTAANEKKLPEHLLDRLLSPLSDQIVTVSEFDRKLYLKHEKLSPKKVSSIYNGINPNQFSSGLSQREARRQAGLSEDKFLIAAIARLVPQKNHHALLNALALLPEPVRSNTQCLIIGSGPLETELKTETSRLGLQDVVSFLGTRSDVPTILCGLDLMVLPSHWECLPIVLLEALAAGCPVVATAVGGVPEVLDGIGWPMVAPDDIDGLVQAMMQIIEMPDSERKHLADLSRRRIKNQFSRKSSVARVEALYTALLREKGLDMMP